MTGEKEVHKGFSSMRAIIAKTMVAFLLCSTFEGLTGNIIYGQETVVDSSETASQPQVTGDSSSESPDSDTVLDTSAIDKIISATGESQEASGAVFNELRLKASKTGKTYITLKWNKISDADGYLVYGNECGKDNDYQLIKYIKKGSTNKYTQKKLTKGTFYKYIVVAYKIKSNKLQTLSISKSVHATTNGGKYGNAKSVKISKLGTSKKPTSITLKVGKTADIRTKETKESKRLYKHRAVSFESTDTSVATVSSKGIIKAVSGGKCKIYVYTQNGKYKKIKVKVTKY